MPPGPVETRRSQPGGGGTRKHHFTEEERQWIEQRLELELMAARFLAESCTLGEVVHKVLPAVCERLSWERGELWNVDHLSNTLECVETWHGPSPRQDELDRITRQVGLPPGIGVPGKVWARQQPFGLADATRDKRSPRAAAMAAAGLHSALGFPIRHDAGVLGVLVFYRSARAAPSPGLLDVFDGLGQHIARFLDRQRADQGLRESEERFRSLSVCSPVGIFQADTRGHCVYTNPRCQAIGGFTLHEGLGDGWTRFIHPDDRERISEEWFMATVNGWNFAGEFRFGMTRGPVRWVTMRSAPMLSTFGERLGSVATVEDITERKRQEAALRHLSQGILKAQERERQRVARELHDGVLQLLSSARFRLEPLARPAVRGDPPNPLEATQALALIDRSIHEVRCISQNLRPSELDDLGLGAAVRDLCAEFRRRSGVKLRLKQRQSCANLTPELELILYRVLQEALTNVEKHARAAHVAVRLSKSDGHLRLSIRDDGRGFVHSAPHSRKPRRSGFGLLHMRERAALAGGHFAVRSAPGQGTEVTVRIPLADATRPR